MAGNVYSWSTTAATNATADSDINFAEGQLPGTVNDSARALMAGVAGFVKDNNATISTTGSANAYAATSSNTIAALATGLRFVFKANFTNTDAATLNLTPSGGAAFGAKSIRKLTTSGDLPLTGGEIQNNGLYIFVYDAAANSAAGGWVLLNAAHRPFSGPDSNLVINGPMEIGQEKGTTAQTSISALAYVADMFNYNLSGTGVVTLQQIADAPTGLKYSSKVTVTTADAAIAAGDFYKLGTAIEGYRIARAGLGAAGALSIALGFWVKAHRTGIYCISFRNAATNRSYVQEYTINAADTWEYKTVVATGDTTGTWATDNSVGLHIGWALAAGSTFQTTNATWAAGNFFATANQVNGVGAVTDLFAITGVSITLGGTPIPQDMSFFTRPFLEELTLCKRYYEKSFNYATAPAQNAGTSTGETVSAAIVGGANPSRWHVPFKVGKRAAPTVTFYNPSAANAQVRDLSAAADCSASSAINIGEGSFAVDTTGNAGTAAGNRLAIHWTADTRI